MEEPARRPRSRRRWILSFHLYGGLACSSYLILYGISSLQFAHQPSFMEGNREVLSWSREIPLPSGDDDLDVAEQLSDALGLFGFPQNVTRSDQGGLRFDLYRPGKSYAVHAVADEGRVEVVEARLKIWGVMGSLHGGGRVRGSPFSTLWWVFTVLTNGVVLFAAASGVYLWTVRRTARRLGIVLLGGTGLSALVLVSYLVWWP